VCPGLADPAPLPLTRIRVAAALELLDEKGMDALTVRRLATRPRR
jgi:hypothetical protein